MTRAPIRELWKVQKPLFSTEEAPQVLVYNEDKSYEGYVPMTDELESMFGVFPKFYVWGMVLSNGIVVMEGKPIPVDEWPDW